MVSPSASPTSSAGPAPETSATAQLAWRAAFALAQRELVRFARQPNRVFGALAQPALFWVLFGAGLGPAFRLAGDDRGSVSYREYFLPGTVVLVVLFTAIFTTISVIEDRRDGFLQGVLVSPAPRWSLVLGKLLGGATIAWVQGFLFLAAAWFVGARVGLASWVAATLLLGVTAWALTALGFVFAWQTDSSQGYHALMSVVLFPMWLLSGAFFPAQTGWLYGLIRANPLSYAVAGLRHLMFPHSAELLSDDLPSLAMCWLVMMAFTGAITAVCFWAVGRPDRGVSP